MTLLRKSIAILLIVSMLSSLCGCWNYRLLEDLAIVAGMAIDKGTDDRFELTIEIAEAKSGKERIVASHIIHTSGQTIFDAVRDGISIVGKKLYWSHTKSIIVSEEIARDEMSNVMDWLARDGETRTDIEMFVAQGIPAKDILQVENPSEEILSYSLESMVLNEDGLSKAHHTQTWKYVNDLISPGIYPTVPCVRLWDDSEGQTPTVEGTALFHNFDIVGFLDGDQTNDFLYIKNKIEGGLLVYPFTYQGKEQFVSLEIFKNETKFETKWNDSIPEITLRIETTAAIDELHGTPGEIGNELTNVLERTAQEYLKKRIETTIQMVQGKYKLDVFGFGNYIYRTEPHKWKALEPNWDDTFTKLKVNVETQVSIKNSATVKKTIPGGVG
ncbi:MAG: Ger(x)C family spore germination protein [Clostridium sp.]|uniref:Ger(x)C family spore germination protein n=1 Tax=Clostridium sp. TaxID=1506 RepID=UPI002912B912|nr:Ger(x)C family spore germination protein [Clostridium sp.]MDU7337697.1 Ger(x)C family spore germination protein [Clostridium sp.]